MRLNVYIVLIKDCVKVINKPCVRDARYVCLISWIPRSGSEQLLASLLQIFFTGDGQTFNKVLIIMSLARGLPIIFGFVCWVTPEYMWKILRNLLQTLTPKCTNVKLTKRNLFAFIIHYNR